MSLAAEISLAAGVDRNVQAHSNAFKFGSAVAEHLDKVGVSENGYREPEVSRSLIMIPNLACNVRVFPS